VRKGVFGQTSEKKGDLAGLFARLFFCLLNNGETVVWGLRRVVFGLSRFLAIVQPLFALFGVFKKVVSCETIEKFFGCEYSGFSKLAEFKKVFISRYDYVCSSR
jgi:hypothetical protein